MELKKTVERIIPMEFKTREEYLLFLRHRFAYEKAVTYLEKDYKLLEIGFGEGYGACYVDDHVQAVDALDVHKNSVVYANEKYGTESCSFIHYTGENLPFQDDTYDAVITFQVIEHIEDDHRFLQEIKRVLKKNSPALITTPNRETRLGPEEEPWNEFHVREYSKKQLQDLLNGYFNRVQILGVRGERQVEKIEKNRTERTLSLYKLLPNALKRFFTGDFMSEYDTEVFYLEEEQVRKAMDLFAIAVK